MKKKKKIESHYFTNIEAKQPPFFYTLNHVIFAKNH